MVTRPSGFVLDSGFPPRPSLEAKTLGYGGARTLYRKRRPHCRSLDGVASVTHKGRQCATCDLKNACVPQVRLDLVVENRPFRLLLAHTSARNFLHYEAALRQRRLTLELTRHVLTVTNRGTWGEIHFANKDD